MALQGGKTPTSTTTIKGVWQYSGWPLPGASTLSSWNSLTMTGNAVTSLYYVKVGVFSFDWTSWRTNCALATSVICSTWDGYRGYTLGVQVKIPTTSKVATTATTGI
jgi:hypothetical protein